MNNKNKKRAYTRNAESINTGFQLANIGLFDSNEEEYFILDNKGLKVCITYPTFSNQYYTRELSKLDTLLKEYSKITCYAITNEPVFTQKRLTKSSKLEKFNVLSDFKKRDFARNTATYIYELSQLVKACFIFNDQGKVLYVRYYEDLQEALDINEIIKFIEDYQQNNL